MNDQQREQLSKGEAMDYVDSIPPDEYYETWIGILSERQAELGIALHEKWRGLTLREMLERMLLHDIPFENSILALAPPAHRRKLAEVLQWKKQQLKSRAAVFGNVN